jgi:hypothetical protein
MPSSHVLELSGVLYVHGLPNNLLSISIMKDLGCIVEFNDQQVILQRRCLDPGRVLVRGILEGGLYRVLVDQVRALMHDSNNLCDLWHKRLGHLHYGVLSILKDMMQGLLNFKIKKIRVCKGCALNKHANTAFQSNENRSREIFDLIHSNVCGPITSNLLLGNCNVPFQIGALERRLNGPNRPVRL